MDKHKIIITAWNPNTQSIATFQAYTEQSFVEMLSEDDRQLKARFIRNDGNVVKGFETIGDYADSLNILKGQMTIEDFLRGE